MGDFVPRLQGRAFGEAMVSGHAVRVPFVDVKCHNVSYRTTKASSRLHAVKTKEAIDQYIGARATTTVTSRFVPWWRSAAR